MEMTETLRCQVPMASPRIATIRRRLEALSRAFRRGAGGAAQAGTSTISVVGMRLAGSS